MKTLDEVIKNLEDARVQVETGTGYWVDYRDNDDLKADALHYLKEYRLHKEDIAAAQDELSAFHCWMKEQEKDKLPLTFDELKGMEGKPVWICADYGRCSWGIIDDVYDDEIYIDGEDYDKKDIGAKWQAYRKERYDRK